MFKTVLIDPPWKKTTGGVGHKTLAPSTHYDVQDRHQVLATLNMWMEKHEVAPEAHLYLWTINSFAAGKDQGIIPGMELCKELGFTPITLIPWVKNTAGSPTPYGMRHTEMCIFGVRYRKGMGKNTRYSGTDDPENVVSGKGLCASRDYIIEPRRDHSRKPDEFYEYVEKRSVGPYLEFYSRTARPGWVAEGNQSGLWGSKNKT
jgi:N6-adenosine-specific RNA methylase IME4